MIKETGEYKYQPPEIYRGKLAFDKISSLLKQVGKSSDRAVEKDIQLNLLVNVVDRMSWHASLYYDEANEVQLELVITEKEPSEFKLQFIKDNPEFDSGDGEPETIELEDEENNEFSSIYSLVLTPNNLVIVGGNENISGSALNELATYVEDKDLEISNRLNVKPINKAVFIDAAAISDLTFASKEEGIVVISSEDDFSTDGLSGNFKDQAAWVLASFHFSTYENIFNPTPIDSRWHNIETSLDILKNFNKQYIPEVIRKTQNEKFEMIIRKAIEDLSHKVGEGENISYDDFKNAGYDITQFPVLFELKKNADLTKAYRIGFTDLISIVFSDDDERKQELKNNSDAHEDFESFYKKMLQKTHDSEYKKLDSTAQVVGNYVSKFMHHLVQNYGVTYFELASAASNTNMENCQLDNFCKELNINYEEAFTSWKQNS